MHHALAPKRSRRSWGVSPVPLMLAAFARSPQREDFPYVEWNRIAELVAGNRHDCPDLSAQLDRNHSVTS